MINQLKIKTKNKLLINIISFFVIISLIVICLSFWFIFIISFIMLMVILSGYYIINKIFKNEKKI